MPSLLISCVTRNSLRENDSQSFIDLDSFLLLVINLTIAIFSDFLAAFSRGKRFKILCN